MEVPRPVRNSYSNQTLRAYFPVGFELIQAAISSAGTYVEKSRQNAKIDAVILESEFQMVSRPVSRPVRLGIDGFHLPFLNSRAQRPRSG